MDADTAIKERKFDHHMELLRNAKELSVHALLVEVIIHILKYNSTAWI